ncbi:phosphoglyceromutase [Alicyclobacillus hesperidum URH17-3-68]|nr:phosphoglyceromutase [Alicyclobacillus hesperidum URH17-3-68]
MRRRLLLRSPAVSMPPSVEFVQRTKYSGGLNPFAKKRT